MNFFFTILFRFTILIAFIGCSQNLFAQQETFADKLINFPDKVFNKIDQKAAKFDANITKGTEKYLAKLKKQEKKLYHKLWKKDSTAAKELFGNINVRYNTYQQELQKPLRSFTSLSNTYNSRLDTLNTSFDFLQQNVSLPAQTQTTVNASLNKFKELQGKLNAGDQIRKALQQRRKLLQERLQQLGIVKQFKQFKKQIFYYQAQLLEYKSIFENPARLEQKLLEWVVKIPAFQQFFANQSQLGNLFALPGGSNATASLAGLQTRAMVQQNLAMQFGTGPQVQQQLQQGMSEAQNMLNELKNKINLSGGSASDEDMPDFKPNSQRTKSLLKRLDYGVNISSQKATNFFPATSDIGLQIGFKPNDKSVIGVGLGGRIGWGRGWNNIHITGSGYSFRSYLDIKLKGSFWISGGYERVYRSEIRNIDQLRNRSAWSTAGLAGISKIVSFPSPKRGKPEGGFFKKTKLQLLWNFLSAAQIPRSQAIIFRIGYHF